MRTRLAAALVALALLASGCTWPWTGTVTPSPNKERSRPGIELLSP